MVCSSLFLYQTFYKETCNETCILVGFIHPSLYLKRIKLFNITKQELVIIAYFKLSLNHISFFNQSIVISTKKTNRP